MSRLFIGCLACFISSSADITFANSLDPDQARQNVGPDLDPNCLTLLVLLKECFEDGKEACKITQHPGNLYIWMLFWSTHM